MAATIVVEQRSGLGYSATNVAKNEFYFLPIDSNVEEASDYPLTKPDVGTIYSYEVWLRFRCDVAPDSFCNNFKIWSSGSAPATGQVITVNSNMVEVYIAPANSQSVQGNRANLHSYNSGSKLAIAGSLANIGDRSSFIVLQLEVASTAVNGIQDYTLYYQYDEV